MLVEAAVLAHVVHASELGFYLQAIGTPTVWRQKVISFEVVLSLHVQKQGSLG